MSNETKAVWLKFALDAICIAAAAVAAFMMLAAIERNESSIEALTLRIEALEAAK